MSTPANPAFALNADAAARFAAEQAAANAALFQTVSNAVAAPDAPNAVPQKITIPIGGREITFDSPEALAQAISAMDAAARKEVETAAQQAEQLRAELESRQAQNQPKNEKPKMTDADLQAISAQKGTSSAILAALGEQIWGITDPEQVAQMMRATHQKAIEASTNQVIQGFTARHPEIAPRSPEAQAIVQILRQNGLPETEQGLEAAHALFLRDVAPKMQQPAAPASPYQQPPMGSPYTPPPSYQQPGAYFNTPQHYQAGVQQPAQPVSPWFQQQYAQAPAMRFAPPQPGAPGMAPQVPTTDEDWSRLAKSLTNEQLDAAIRAATGR